MDDPGERMEMNDPRPTRRSLLVQSGAAVAAIGFANARAQTLPATTATSQPTWDGPIIDIHQHTTYLGRSDGALLHHQKRMGVTQTILLPSGSPVNAPSTLLGKANGLYAGAGPMSTVIPIAESHPGEYFFFSNEVPDIPDAIKNIEAGLKKGAIGIGEQKFNLPVDCKEMQAIYALAAEYRVPVLMHFQYQTFNTAYERFGDMLKKYPTVNFIGHANLFWSSIDAKCDPKIAYPKGKVTPGGLTDRYLSDYPNFYGDLSAYSGLNAFIRDEDHTRGFIDRHQDWAVMLRPAAISP